MLLSASVERFSVSRLRDLFLEILKAVCPSFDWVPKFIKKGFQTREQKFLQGFETMVGADDT